MILDGEYRTAFIKAEHPELNYGTAPLPVPDDQQDRYGSGYITGSIMGIPKGSSNEAAAWELVKYMTTNTDALVKLANGLANVPTTPQSAKSPDLHLVPQFKPFVDIFQNPNSETNPPKASGAAYQEIFESFISKWEAGQVDDLAVRARGRRQAGRRPGAERVGRSGAVIAAAEAMSTAVAGALRASAAPTPERQRARRKAAWRRRRFVLLLMSPWLARVRDLLRLSADLSFYLSFTHYDLLSSPRWVGFANYDFLFGADQQMGPAVYNTLWMIAIAVPMQVLFAFSIALMITRARLGVGLFRTIFYLPTMAPAVAATLGFVFLFNPATGPVNTILAPPRDHRTAVVPVALPF